MPFLMLVLLLANLRMSFEVERKLDNLAERRIGKACLPLPSMPLRLIQEDPVRAQRVLEATNVTNLRVLAREEAVPNGPDLPGHHDEAETTDQSLPGTPPGTR